MVSLELGNARQEIQIYLDINLGSHIFDVKGCCENRVRSVSVETCAAGVLTPVSCCPREKWNRLRRTETLMKSFTAENAEAAENSVFSERLCELSAVTSGYEIPRDAGRAMTT